MRLPYNDLLNEAAALVRAQRPILVALAGAFFFLPSLLAGYLTPLELTAGESLIEALPRYAASHWPTILAFNLVEMLGTLTMLRLFLKPDGRTVGAAIAASFAALPVYFLVRAAANVAVAMGAIAFFVPGIYLAGRLALLGAVIVAEEIRNPVDAFRRSFHLTRGHGFAVAGIFLILYVIGWLTGAIATAAVGSVGIIAAGRDAGLLAAAAGGAVVQAAVDVLLVALAAVIYTRLRAGGAAAASR